MAASNENVDKYSCPKQDMNDLYLNLINTRKKTWWLIQALKLPIHEDKKKIITCQTQCILKSTNIRNY